ncbi:MAG: helix-turn-helix domain-containing protein [Cetobacterium sp.]|uniref:helix-turn-helix domain-containing protein n=1 Tax=Cetobacterium sp. TaxID=2071632 RepID=UPI003EE6432C
MTFGTLLKLTMKKHKITGKDLSIFSNLTEGFISDIKNEKTIPREQNLNKIIEALKIPLHEKVELQIAWEKISSPKNFVKRFEELEADFNILSSFYIVNDVQNSTAIKKSILELKRDNQVLKKELEFLRLYKEFFLLLSEDDMKYLITKITFFNKKDYFKKLLNTK